jgi:putative YhdH/YhfP family quinone oxidoreductase
MEKTTFRAMVVSETEEKIFHRAITTKSIDDLPTGDVVVRVQYSSLNYKDALSATGNKGVTRKYPHTPGIDAAGVVAQSTDDRFQSGDQVIITGYDLGMNTSGGFGQYIRVPADWIVPLPENLTLRQSMCYGTAGLTAALAVCQLVEHGITPNHGAILVSGATGGVGSVAVSILDKMGFSVTAINGVTDKSDHLKSIGARDIISIEEAIDQSGRPLLKSRWAGSIDTVGGDILATTIKALNAYGVAATCGNAASADLPINVYPFILRGAMLVGIDSQNCPMPLRRKTWQRLAAEWKISNMEEMVEEIGLDELDQCIGRMLGRGHKGRSIINLG